LDEHLSFIPIKYKAAVRLSAFSFVAAYNGQWEQGDWEHFLAELVATTDLKTLESDPESRDSIGMYLEKLKTLYHQEGEEAFAKRVGEARQTNFQMENVPDWLLTVGSSVWGSVKSLLAWLRHLWAAELKAESLPRSIPLAMRGLLGTLFPVIKLKYVFVLLGAVVVGGWGANALRYRGVVSALEDRRFESALKAASALESSFSSRFHAYNPLEAIWLKPAFRRLVDEQVSFAAYEVGETVRLSKRTALFTELPDLPLLDLTLEEHQDELRWNDRPTPASRLMDGDPGLALFSDDGALETTLLEVWAWQKLRQRPHPRFGSIPFVISLADFVGGAPELSKHLVASIRATVKTHGADIPEEVVFTRASRGGFLLVLTNAESSGDPVRTAAAVRTLVADPRWQRNRWWVAYRIDFSRRTLRPSLSPLNEVWVTSFQESEVAEVVRTTFPEAGEMAADELRNAPRLARALRNPLVVGMFLKYYRRSRIVPGRLGTFYQAVATEALASSPTPSPDGDGLSPQAKELLLGALAESMGPGPQALSRFKAEAAIARTLGSSEDVSVAKVNKASQALGQLLQTPLLITDASLRSWSTEHEVRFLLPSFRDYFHATVVARRLPEADRRKEAETELSAFLDDPAMQSTASLLLGLLEDSTVVFDQLLARSRMAKAEGFPKTSGWNDTAVWRLLHPWYPH
jgi:hypothetical protein